MLSVMINQKLLIPFSALILVGLIGLGFWQQSHAPATPVDSANKEMSLVDLTNPDDLARYNQTLGLPQFAEVSTENVTYYTKDDGTEVKGYLAAPEGEGPFPALVLIHEWWGLNDNIRDLAEDFAGQGYVALAVDLYDGESGSTPEEARALAGAVRENTEGAFANLNAAVEYLSTQPNIDASRLGSVGWCFGGQWSYNMAVNNLGTAASVMYYGRFSADDDLSMMRAQILGHFGEEDTGILVDDVKQFKAKLDTLNGNHAVYIYPNAGHAFANEDNEDAYNEEAAQQAWERTLEFLAENL